MEKIKDCIVKRIGDRFSLKVAVKEPKPAKEGARVNVDKWMVSIETSPGKPDVPRQKIKLKIANIPAYTREAVPLRMNYSVLEGMNRVIVVAETIDEILADKVVALPTSIAKLEGGSLISTPTKIRHRDIWDLAWLVEQGAKLDPLMVKAKIDDYGIQNYEQLRDHAIQAVSSIASGAEFKAQMQRFIRKSSHDNAFGKPGFDAYLSNTVNRLFNETKSTLTVQPQAPTPVGPRTRRMT
jgi:hypothetical protein